jgi:hypothetical protein
MVLATSHTAPPLFLLSLCAFPPRVIQSAESLILIPTTREHAPRLEDSHAPTRRSRLCSLSVGLCYYPRIDSGSVSLSKHPVALTLVS